MFLPVGDSPNLDKTPWMTWGLIAVNVAIHLWLWPLAWQEADPRDPLLDEYRQVIFAERGVVPSQISRGDLVLFEHGVRPDALTLLDILTSMFLHAGLAHLFGNMLFLWIFGDNVEHRLGRGVFLLVYLLTGVAATLGDTLLRWGSDIPSVGASGAISGVLGLYFAWFPHNRVRVFVFLFPFFMNVIELRARFVLGFYLIAQNLLPLLITGGAGGVSYGAHLGGFLTGWGAAGSLSVLLAARRRPGSSAETWTGGERSRRPSPMEGPGAPGGDLGATFRAALARGELGDAATLLFESPRALTRSRLGAADKVALGDALAAAGQPRAALAAYQRALADHPLGPGRVRAYLGAARVQLLTFGSPTAAYQHVYAAMEEEPSPAEAAEARSLLRQIAASVRSVPRTSRW